MGMGMSSWRLIETAPKDGSRVIVGWIGITGPMARYARYPTNAWYDSSTGRVFKPEQPTHWMPVPDPPNDPNIKVPCPDCASYDDGCPECKYGRQDDD